MAKKKKTYNTRLIKATFGYTVQEIGELYNLHKATVLDWIKRGLPIIDEKRPYLIYGGDLIDFLNQRQKKQKCKSQSNEMYCLKCRKSQTVLKNQITVKYLNEKRIHLKGLCEKCGCPVCKLQSLKKLPEIDKIFTVLRQGGKDLIEPSSPILNTDFKKELET